MQLAVKFDIMNNGCVSYHNFLRHFLLNLKPAEAKRAFERRELPLPVTVIGTDFFFILQFNACMK